MTDSRFAAANAITLTLLGLAVGWGACWLASQGPRECSFEFTSPDSVRHVWITECKGEKK
jgi:hypothetical protein